MKVALYVRVSTLEQAEEGYSIGEQKNKLIKYCDIKDWDVVKIYSDPGFSGSNLNRPSIQQLISDANTGLYDAVLVYKLDRLSRSQKDTLYLIEDIFQKNDIHFISLSENFDTSTAFGKAMIGILSVFAQLEREQIKERMMMGKAGRAKSGKITAWATIPFGYIKDNETYKIDPLRSEIVQKIFSDYLNGKSVTRIKNDLNQEGHIGKDINWSYRTVRQVLGNATYTGRVNFHGETYKGMHPRIISDEDYNEVQKQLKIRQHDALTKFYSRPFQSKYMLSGLLKCGYCGATLAIQKSTYKGHSKWRYNCPTNIKKRNSTYSRNGSHCEFKFVYRNALEQEVISAIKKLSLDPSSVIKEAQRPASKSDINISTVKKELSKIKKQQSKLVDLYMLNDALNIDELTSRANELKRQQKALEAKLKPFKTDNSKIEDFQKVLVQAKEIDKLPYKDQKFIVNRLIKTIDTYNDKIKINWNF